MTYLEFREPFNAWSHGLWLLMSLPATFVLLRRCEGDRLKRLTLLVFGLTMACCYCASMLYHGVRLEKEGIDFFERLDHIGIHLLIAGTYTPLAWTLMRASWRWGTLAAVWSTTLVGSGLLVANIRLPIPLATCEYLAMGWGALLCYFQMSRVLSHRSLAPLVVGGVFYSVGAVINLMHWPVLWPGVIDPHGVFHLWVMAGSSVHFWFMLTAVVPLACTRQAEAEPVANWEPGHPRAPRAVFLVNLFTGRFHHG
jgi:hemolysin III